MIKLVDKFTYEYIKPEGTGCGFALRFKKVPLSERGEELAKDRDFNVIENKLNAGIKKEENEGK